MTLNNIETLIIIPTEMELDAFKKEFDNGIVIVMFWPWSDGVHITLKIALLNKYNPALNF